MFVITHRVVYQKRENFTACKFYLSKLKYMYKQATSEVKESKKLCLLFVCVLHSCFVFPIVGI